MPTSTKLEALQVIKMPKNVYNIVGNTNDNGLHVVGKDDTDNKLEVYSIKYIDNVKNELTKADEELAKDIEELTKADEELAKDIEELTKADEELDKKIEELTKADEELAKDIEEIKKGVDIEFDDVATKSLDFVLYASNWTDKTYTITHEDIDAECDGILNLSNDISMEEYKAAENALMKISSQSDNTIVITADGEVPTIDIPVTLVIFGIMAENDPQYAPINSPAFTGTPTAPTADKGTNSTQIATTEFVQTAIGDINVSIPEGEFAPLNSPAFTGTPTAPTATKGTNTKQLATTEFVQNAINDIAINEFEINDASSTTKGIVMLYDGVDSTDKTKAATPNSVKTAYDLANTAKSTADTAKSTADTAKSTADDAKRIAEEAKSSASDSCPNITYGTSDLEAGVSILPTGDIYLVYE